MRPGRGIHAGTPVITFVGKSGTGKTTLLEKLIPLLRRSGIRLAVVKHDVHGFQMDTPGKDTWRFSAAGAEVVAISSREQVAIIEQLTEELQLDEIISRLPPDIDLILTEGYKSLHNPKIELHRKALNRPLLAPAEELLAVLTDEPVDTPAPQLALDDLAGCVRVILDYMKALGWKN